MPSVIEICNLSLSAIGQGTINALNEASPQAKACSLHYTNTRDELLREFPWNFATRSVVLAQVDVKIPGWDYVYQHPPKALWIRKIFNEYCVDPDVPNEYEILSTGTEKYICTDVEQAYAKCTIKIEDPALFDPLFVKALSFQLALDLSMPLTNSTSRSQEVNAKLQQAMANAKLAGAVEGGQKKTPEQRPKSERSYINAYRR